LSGPRDGEPGMCPPVGYSQMTLAIPGSSTSPYTVVPNAAYNLPFSPTTEQFRIEARGVLDWVAGKIQATSPGIFGSNFRGAAGAGAGFLGGAVAGGAAGGRRAAIGLGGSAGWGGSGGVGGSTEDGDGDISDTGGPGGG
jgi:hypothetical protein